MSKGLLVLTRRDGERLKIGNDITLTVLSSKGSQVRIGIDAPRDVEVHREEIYNRIHGINTDTNRSAVSPDIKTDSGPDASRPAKVIYRKRKVSVT